jgi:hypothetical protein
MPTRSRRSEPKGAGMENGGTGPTGDAPVLDMGKRLLPVALTQAERADAGQKLALLIHQRRDLVADLKAQAADGKDALKLLDQRIDAAAEGVEQGTESRLVSVALVANYAAGTADWLRTDTAAVVESRPLSDLERQQGFNFRDQAPDPDAPDAGAPA